MSTTQPRRRVIFHGHAVPFHGRITSIDDKPFHEVVPGPPASALSVEGGLSQGNSQGGSHRNIFHWGRTLAECKGEILPNGHAAAEVSSSVEELVVFNKPHRFEAGHLRIKLVSDLAHQGHPSIVPAQVAFDDVRVDGHPVEIAYDKDLSGLPTFAEFEAQYKGDRAFHRKYQHCHHSPTEFKSGLPRNPGGKVALSFVHELKWNGTVYPGNVLPVKGFGKIHFGEVLMDEHSRTIAMVRMELGCSTGGNGGGSTAQNGQNWGT